MRLSTLLVLISGAGLLLGAPRTRAQVGGDASQSAGEGSGPVSELSVPLGTGSRPVHERGRTVREGSGGPVKSGPVRDASTRSMKSGPVSELSRGPVSAGRSMTGSGSIGASSAGAVKKDLASPLGERLSRPLTDLAPLQNILRQRAAAARESAANAEPPAPADDGGPLHEPEARFEPDHDEDLAEEPVDLIEEAEPAEPDR